MSLRAQRVNRGSPPGAKHSFAPLVEREHAQMESRVYCLAHRPGLQPSGHRGLTTTSRKRRPCVTFGRRLRMSFSDLGYGIRD